MDGLGSGLLEGLIIGSYCLLLLCGFFCLAVRHAILAACEIRSLLRSEGKESRGEEDKPAKPAG